MCLPASTRVPVPYLMACLFTIFYTFCLSLCVTCIHAYKCVQPCINTETRCPAIALFIILSLDRLSEPRAILVASKPCWYSIFTPDSAGIMDGLAGLFMWVLRIYTQVFILGQQALLPTEPSP